MRISDLPLPNRLRFATMLKKPNGKRLNEHQHCEIISKLSKMNVPTLAREYNVSEGANAELEKFVHIDDEDNEKYATVVLEDVEELLETMKIVEMAMDDDDVNTQELNVGLKNEVIFQGFDFLYKQVLDIEDQLLCLEVQTEAEETFDDLKKSFESFQSKIRTIDLKAKRKKLQNLCQMTIHDMFN